MKKYLTSYFSILMLLGMMTSCTTDDVEGEIPSDGGDEVDPVEIPDKAFGEYMLYNEVPGITSETENNEVKYFLNPDEVLVVSELSLSKTGSNVENLTEAGLETADIKITDLTGIEYFLGLQRIVLTSNDLENIDVTELTGLEELEINFNLIGNLDLSNNTELTKLRYRGSAQAENNQKLSSLDLSNNSQLRHLYLENQSIVSIDLSNNTQIDELLDLTGNPGPDGNPDTADIIVPAEIYDQLYPENRLGVISEADVETTVFLSVEPTLISEDEGISTLTVSLNRSSDVPVEINLDFSGSATFGVDYTADETVSIPAGELEASIDITAIQDSDVEGDETIEIGLGVIDNAVAGENQEVTITIEDDDFNVPLILNEILYDPWNNGLNGDANGDGSYAQNEDEFIELYNDSNSPLDISGFKVFDSEALANNTPRHIIPEGTILPAHSAIVIFGGGNPTGDFGGAIVQTSTTGDMNLNNAGDILTIQDEDGVVVITFDIEPLSNNPNESYTRNPDLTGDFVQHGDINGILFSPGTKVDGSSF